MTVFIIREGKVVEKGSMQEARDDRRSIFPAPRVSRMDSFESPVTGESISSWRQRERDMSAADAVDRRDIPQAAFDKRKRIEERNAKAK